jgi:hypothetical protein
MGWAESPAYFCTATETGRDLIQWLVESGIELPPHPLEGHMIPVPATPGTGDGANSIHVYVDDYVLAILQDAACTMLRRVARATLFGIHAIFPPPEVSGHADGKDPISIKKVRKRGRSV